MQHQGAIPIQPIGHTVIQAVPIVITPLYRRVKFEPNTKHANYTMILEQIIVAIKKNNIKEYDVDVAALSHALSNLVLRMRKSVMEMIAEYKAANGGDVVIMGRLSNVPYRGTYDKPTDTASYDLMELPPSLVIILHQFTLMVSG